MSKNPPKRRSAKRHPQRAMERDQTPPKPQTPDGSRALAMVTASAYVMWVIVVPPRWISPELRRVWRAPQLAVHKLVALLYDVVGLDAPSLQLQAAGFYVIAALIVPSVIAILLCRGRLADIGWRRPNRLLLRVVTCSFVVSIPFLYWMVNSPGFVAFYKPYLDAGPIRVILYYLVVLLCEHSLMEGIMLGVFRRGHRWPAPPSLVNDAETRRRRALQWIGLAQPTSGAKGVQAFTRWVGLPDGCVAATLLSGVLFGMVHWGKEGREFLLSFPGGIFLAYLAYRCNSWHAPYILHASTVAAAGVMLLLLRGG